MSFVYPLGLLGLIGIPIVILIYILRSKYNEQTITSTYIWELSEKFLKRKNPLSGLTGLISLILQILTVTVISLAIARPVFVLPGAAYNYCFVLDASGSMNIEQGKTTRFEVAKDEIVDVIKDAKDGSSFTLLCVADESIITFQGITDKKYAIELVEDVESKSVAVDTMKSLSTAQAYFTENPSALMYLVTDKSFSDVANINVITVTDNVTNYAISDVKYSHAGGKLTVGASVVAYGKDADISIRLSVDGVAKNEGVISVKDGELSPISIECTVPRFSSFTVEILNSDAYDADNVITTYNLDSDKTYSTLIVSETGFFFEAVLDALLDSEVTVMSPDEYEKKGADGVYGLYIFDSYEPPVLPNGAVWLINPDTSIKDSGFNVKGKISLSESNVIKKSASTSTMVRKLLEGIEGDEIYIKNYVKYSGMYLNFHTLFTYDSNPIIFAGANGLGNRQVVFAFDVHESDIALSTDFVMLIGNLIEYSFPDVIDSSDYVAGDEVLVNITSTMESVKAIAPSGEEVYMESDGATATLQLSEVGTYRVIVTEGGKNNEYPIYAAAPLSESVPVVAEQDFSLSGERENVKIDGKYDPSTLLFVMFVLLFIADWGVYCYEKYQLR